MSIIALLLLVALMIPSWASSSTRPSGGRWRAAWRDRRRNRWRVGELAKKVELLESDVDDLSRAVQELKEENQFLQRLIEDAPPRTLPPPPNA